MHARRRFQGGTNVKQFLSAYSCTSPMYVGKRGLMVSMKACRHRQINAQTGACHDILTSRVIGEYAYISRAVVFNVACFVCIGLSRKW